MLIEFVYWLSKECEEKVEVKDNFSDFGFYIYMNEDAYY